MYLGFGRRVSKAVVVEVVIEMAVEERVMWTIELFGKGRTEDYTTNPMYTLVSVFNGDPHGLRTLTPKPKGAIKSREMLQFGRFLFLLVL